MLVHREFFCEYFRMNTLTIICFLSIPLILFVFYFFYHFMKKRRDQIMLNLGILFGTACTYMTLWIFFTPTARAWPRRIINGYILQEIAFVISLYLLWKILSTTAPKAYHLKKIAGGQSPTAAILFLVFTFGLCFWFLVSVTSPGNGKFRHGLDITRLYKDPRSAWAKAYPPSWRRVGPDADDAVRGGGCMFTIFFVRSAIPDFREMPILPGWPVD